MNIGAEVAVELKVSRERNVHVWQIYVYPSSSFDIKSWNKSDDASSLVGKTRPKHGHTDKCLHNTPLVFHCTTLTPL